MSRSVRRTLVAVTLLLGAAATPAGVTVYGDSPPVITLIAGTVVDDSDPLGWTPMGPATPGQLQGSGGPPDVAFLPPADYPKAVWASNEQLDSEIAFSEWTGSGWSPTELLTDNLGPDLDPRIFVDPDGTVYVVWWEVASNDRVRLMRRRPGFSTWDPPVIVSAAAEAARRPSVHVFDGQLWVAYERDASGGAGTGQDIVVALRLPGGGFDRQVVASTAHLDRLDVLLHSAGDKLWIDWKNSYDEFGRSELESGTWRDGAMQDWTDPSWVGQEGARKLIQWEVVGD